MKTNLLRFAFFSLVILIAISGCTGKQGPQGPAGANGSNGSQGPQGPAGANGSNGQQGAQGITGTTMPVIQSLSVVGLPANPGSPVTATVMAQSAQNLALTYTWSTSSGWIISSGGSTSTATITAPSTYGAGGTATIEVSDTQGEYAIGIIALSTADNTYPVISSIAASPDPIAPKGTITVLVNASDPNGNALNYTWTTTTGWTISSGQATSGINVTAPSTYSTSGYVTVTVSDNYGGFVTGTISVATATDIAPVISSIAIYPQPVYTSANLVCHVYNPDGNILNYTWLIGGTSVTTGSSALWYSPGIPGYYTVGITVTDNYGNTVSGSSSINIASASPWPKFHMDIQSIGLSPIDTSSITGTLKWSYTTGNSVYSSPAIGADGTIYVESVDYKLYAINQNGTLKWSYTTGNSIHSSPAIGADGTIYIGSWDNNLYAINPNGTLKWRYTTGNSIYSSPAIGADGTIYVGSVDNKLYAINPNGTLKWSYTTGNYIYSSPAIGADGTIYVGSQDGHLYAIH